MGLPTRFVIEPNNANLAINIAEPILFNIYGKNKILKEQPYQIRLVDNYWIIIGSTSDNNLKGGSFEIIISSRNGAIKGLSHGK